MSAIALGALTPERAKLHLGITHNPAETSINDIGSAKIKAQGAA